MATWPGKILLSISETQTAILCQMHCWILIDDFCLSSLGIFCTFCSESEAVFFAASERNHLFEKAGSARRQPGPQGILAQADEIDVGGRIFDKWQGKKQKGKKERCEKCQNAF